MRITAAVSRSPDSPFTLESVDLDDTRPDEVLVRISATGLCHTTGLPDVVAAALGVLESRGTLVVVGLGPRHATIDVVDLLLNGKMIRGCIEGDANPSEFIPELIALHAQGRFPMEAIVRRYDARDIETAVADSRSGSAIKPVLVW